MSKGKIVAVASVSGCFSPPKMSIYGATKAAIINFYETLWMELEPEIGITIVTPGLIKTEITTPGDIAEEESEYMPTISASRCARGIVDGVCRRERFVTDPSWVGGLIWLKTLCPELVELMGRLHMKLKPKHD